MENKNVLAVVAHLEQQLMADDFKDRAASIFKGINGLPVNFEAFTSMDAPKEWQEHGRKAIRGALLICKGFYDERPRKVFKAEDFRQIVLPEGVNYSKGIKSNVFSVGLGASFPNIIANDNLILDKIKLGHDIEATVSEVTAAALILRKKFKKEWLERKQEGNATQDFTDKSYLGQAVCKQIANSAYVSTDRETAIKVRQRSMDCTQALVNILAEDGYAIHVTHIDEVLVSKKDVWFDSEVEELVGKADYNFSGYSGWEVDLIRNACVMREGTCMFMSGRRYVTGIEGRIEGNFRKDFRN